MGLRNLIPKAWRKRQSDNYGNGIPRYSPRSGPIHLETSPSRQAFPPSAGSSRSSSLRGSPERFRRDSYLGPVQEEVAGPNDEPMEISMEDEGTRELQEDVDWELEQIGMYRGSYPRLVAIYTLVPITSTALLFLIALTPRLIWPLPDSTVFPAPAVLPFPLAELLLSIALWSLSHTMHVPIYTLFAFLAPDRTDAASVLSTTTHVILTNLLRLSATVMLNVRHEMEFPKPTWEDPAFRRVIWLALGWAAAEGCAGVWQGYEMIGMYRDVLVAVPEGREREVLDVVGGIEERNESPDMMAEMAGSGFLEVLAPKGNVGIDEQLDQDVERLLRLKAREEVVEVYGMPAIVSLSLLQISPLALC